ncbi:bifunctional polysaccharide deacetylase/glycosyltransferase family 2 protein [Kocuria rosea]|uniref:bifunctional polysaccharide deacetylase/glycosyltransferase family 2 protein n=1 Tax=Kocuria rosea TaxID=1275 RepID=UPI00203C9BE4|nr:bifunctional polysaccharide deacetylase/glycosyltransferase family 2 protein [Kocuria rosea]MCM3485064.1 bifunctional polysaccharide deacetylase/glycosyltransferase family 2 protein [Kocuria rosea]MEB2526462.1 bifunctional polysaccharide deacetylase/glycosyltransferase family 2 protein [Kocuria rosea]MEB2618027.1 bifunctional polysaccharide deacetylase/glycosyltransferase family 2 protein [Kocuria rosea]
MAASDNDRRPPHRRRAERTGSSAAPPVFFDPSGKRWYRILATLVVLLALAAGAVSWIVPQALAQPWERPLHQENGYPRELIATGDQENIPLLGDASNPFSRIGLVEETEAGTVLRSPFSEDVFRVLTDEERELVGDSPYVMERFGELPEKQLMLTFDDGPDATYTGEILDVLSAEGVPATFFSVGTNVVGQPELFRRIVREGHMVGNHTMTHTTAWDDDLRNREELIGTDRAMRSVGSYATHLFRLPTGDPDNKALPILEAQQLGYLHVDFDYDTHDWEAAPGETVDLPALDGEGHIVLMHDGGGDRTATVAALKELITEAKAQGYTFSTLAPIVPEGYLPAADTEPVLADDATALAVAGLTVAPDVVMTWLFWFGIGSLTLMSALYVVLALIGHRRQTRRAWPELPEDRLPLVSVILPVFNEEPVIARTLAALRASDYPNLEVIAVDDGSTDRTLAIMREHAASWPALTVITQPNGGKSIASNHGIMAARGEIVVTLDGDTLFEPQTVRMFARHFYAQDAKRPVGAVAGHVKVGNRTGLLTMWQSLEYISGICVTRMGEGVAGAISIVPGACAAWRKEALQAAGGYSHDTLAEDADLTMTLQKLGWSVVQENRAVAWTEAPMTVRGLAKQRLRWTYGNLQALWKHAGMLFRPRYGFLGMVALPYTLLATLVPLVFLPLTVLMAGINLAAGNWQPIAAFAAFVLAIHAVICVLAIRMVGESWTHLLVVPVYRVIYEPLRAYLLYASLLQALRGRMIGWYKPERTNSVIDLTPAADPAGREAPWQEDRRGERV